MEGLDAGEVGEDEVGGVAGDVVRVEGALVEWEDRGASVTPGLVRTGAPWPPGTGNEPVTSACGWLIGTTPSPAREITTHTRVEPTATTPPHTRATSRAARSLVMRTSSRPPHSTTRSD